MESSKDDSSLFTVAMDGTMIVWDITAFDYNRTIQRKLFDYSVRESGNLCVYMCVCVSHLL